MEMTTMTLKVQYLTKLEEGTQIRAGWYVTTPFCPEVVFATEQEALAYGRTEELRQELMDRVRAMSSHKSPDPITRRTLKRFLLGCRVRVACMLRLPRIRSPDCGYSSTASSRNSPEHWPFSAQTRE